MKIKFMVRVERDGMVFEAGDEISVQEFYEYNLKEWVIEGEDYIYVE